jgi:hypothetical protein
MVAYFSYFGFHKAPPETVDLTSILALGFFLQSCFIFFHSMRYYSISDSIAEILCDDKVSDCIRDLYIIYVFDIFNISSQALSNNHTEVMQSNTWAQTMYCSYQGPSIPSALHFFEIFTRYNDNLLIFLYSSFFA